MSFRGQEYRQGGRAERPQRKRAHTGWGRCNRRTFRKWDGSEKASLEESTLWASRFSGKEGKKMQRMFREEIRCRQSKEVKPREGREGERGRRKSTVAEGPVRRSRLVKSREKLSSREKNYDAGRRGRERED